MGGNAYQLERFAAPERQQKPRVRVAKRRASRAASPVLRMVRILATAIVMVVLVGGVLYTQAAITELQGQIAAANNELVEETALHDYYTYKLESMTNIRNVEQRAAELGLVKINQNQQTYVRVADGDQIEVRENPLESLLNKARTGLLTAAEDLSPLPVDDEGEVE